MDSIITVSPLFTNLWERYTIVRLNQVPIPCETPFFLVLSSPVRVMFGWNTVGTSIHRSSRLRGTNHTDVFDKLWRQKKDVGGHGRGRPDSSRPFPRTFRWVVVVLCAVNKDLGRRRGGRKTRRFGVPSDGTPLTPYGRCRLFLSCPLFHSLVQTPLSYSTPVLCTFTP